MQSFSTQFSIKNPIPSPSEEQNSLIALSGDPYDQERNRVTTESLGILYQQHGIQCLSLLSGPFSGFIHDREQNRLIGFRDPLGLAPFFYSSDGEHYICSSSIKNIFNARRVSPRINSGFFAEYLSGTIHTLTESPFQNISRLSPGHVLIVENGSTSIHPFSSSIFQENELSPSGTILREKLFETVQKYLPERKPALLLSGGLDSSSILSAMIETYGKEFLTLYLEIPGRESDEKFYICELEKFFGIQVKKLPLPLRSQKSFQKEVKSLQYFPGYPTSALSPTLLRVLKEHSITHLFSGMGGDELFSSGYSNSFSGVLLDPRFREKIGKAFPGVLKKYLRTIGILPATIPSYLSEQFLNSTDLFYRLQTTLKNYYHLPMHKFSIISSLKNSGAVFRREQESLSAEQHGIQIVHPFYDTDFIQTAYTMAKPQRKRETKERPLQSEMMRGHLPDSIRNRNSKADFSDFFQHSLQHINLESLLKNSALIKKSWINSEKALSTYSRICEASQEPSGVENFYTLWHVFSAELLLQSITE